MLSTLGIPSCTIEFQERMGKTEDMHAEMFDKTHLLRSQMEWMQLWNKQREKTWEIEGEKIDEEKAWKEKAWAASHRLKS